MIGEHIKLFCKDFTKIENYDLAIADTTQTWDCHHRLEISPMGNTFTKKYLIKQGLYYNQPAESLIFLTHSDHMSLHNKDNKAFLGHNHSDETKQKISERLKGRDSPTKGKKWTDDQREKINHKGKNNSMYGKNHTDKTRNKIAMKLKGKDIICIETGEVHYDTEWRRLGYKCAARVAQGKQETCMGLHFKYVGQISIDPDTMLELIAKGLKESAKWNQRDC